MPDGFEEFYGVNRHPVAYALALTLCSRELGAEAADEAMLRAFQRWNRVQRMENPAGWVYRVGLNWGRSRLRSRRRELLGLTADAAVDQPRVGDPQVRQAVAELPLSHRAVVVLRYFADWRLEDIATALRVPVGTVKSRLHRAHAKLERRLEVAS